MTAMPAEDSVSELVLKPFLTRKEAARLANVSTWTVDAWARDPDFPMYKPSARTRLIKTQDFLEWVERFDQRSKTPTPPPPPRPRGMRR